MPDTSPSGRPRRYDGSGMGRGQIGGTRGGMNVGPCPGGEF